MFGFEKNQRRPKQPSDHSLKGLIMNSKAILAIAAFSAIASTGVRADEADGSQYALQFQGSRTRAEVMAEAATVAFTHTTEVGSRVAVPLMSTVDAKALRAEAARAVRLGQIPHGEAGQI